MRIDRVLVIPLEKWFNSPEYSFTRDFRNGDMAHVPQLRIDNGIECLIVDIGHCIVREVWEPNRADCQIDPNEGG